MNAWITLYAGPDECRAQHAGPYIGDVLHGSFVTYVCDKPSGHVRPGQHFDSTMGFAWSEDVEAPRLALAGSNPTG